MRIADYIATTLSKLSKNCYMVTGGGAMHLNDAFGKAAIKVTYCHHEQACSMAAEAEARITGIPAVVNVTTGPGGINAINGVFGAYVDSIPMVVISGQVKRETLVSTYEGQWRQLGDQEVDIVKMVSNVVKYAVTITEPLSVRYHLEKAIFLSMIGRPGPVWLDVPIDVQAMDVDIESLESYDEVTEKQHLFDEEATEFAISEFISVLKTSSRPVIITGFGIWASKTQDNLLRFAESYGIPIVTTFNSNDVIEDEHQCYVGRVGTIGNRSGNFVVQSADLVIVLGSRLNIRIVSYNWNSFAPNAKKVGVDIDSNELNKPTCAFDLKIHSSLQHFFNCIEKQKIDNLRIDPTWLKWSKERLKKYPVCLGSYWDKNDIVNPYCFVDELFNYLNNNDVVVCADGTACVVTFQGMKIKRGQRVFHNSGCASMGYELPAAIGAYNSGLYDRIICIAGDGSIMMNIQELQTISGNSIPVKIFILNNEGYHSIRQTQRNFFKDNIVGCGIDSGLSFPQFSKISNAFGFEYHEISNHFELKHLMPVLLSNNDSFICEVKIDMDQHFSPKLSSRILNDGSMVTSSLEDMWPFLTEDELTENKFNK